MDKSKREILELLSRLYLLIAAIDLDLSEAEEITIREKLKEWAPDFDKQELNSLITSAAGAFQSLDHLQIYNEISETLNEYFDENNKISVLKDLISIARADGSFHDGEKKIINSLAEEWGVDKALDIGKHTGETAVADAPEDAGSILRKAGAVFHDILTLLIYTGSESENSLTDPEWNTIYSGIVNFNLVISGKTFSISKYSRKEISETADVVIERMWGSENQPLDPYPGYVLSVKNMAAYYKSGVLDDSNIYSVIRLMLEVAAADGFVTDSQKNILDEIVKTFREVPGVEKINDLINSQLKKQNPQEKEATDTKPRKGGSIGIVFEAGKEPVKQDKDQPAEIVAEVYKEGGAYHAKIKDTGEDITALIDDPEKLMRASKQSGLVHGRKNKEGGYVWRVMRKKAD